MITNSILFDHDLDLKDDYRRVTGGGSEAGALFRGREMQHHTVVIDRLTGEHASGLRPAFRWRNPDGSYHPWMIGIGGHLVPEAEVYEISSHPIAMSAIFAGSSRHFVQERIKSKNILDSSWSYPDGWALS